MCHPRGPFPLYGPCLSSLYGLSGPVSPFEEAVESDSGGQLLLLRAVRAETVVRALQSVQVRVFCQGFVCCSTVMSLGHQLGRSRAT